jgi:para-nitrobenzyl esterase
MHAAWVRFAATGDPDGPDLPTWPRYEAGAREVLNFNTAVWLLGDPRASERLLRDGLLVPPPADAT